MLESVILEKSVSKKSTLNFLSNLCFIYLSFNVLYLILIITLKVEFYFYLNKDKMKSCATCSHKKCMNCTGRLCEGVCNCVSKNICHPLHTGKCCNCCKNSDPEKISLKEGVTRVTDMTRFKKYAKRKSSKKSIKKSIKKSKKKSVRKNKL